MFCQETFDPWHSTIMTHLPHLSKTQATGLALWSLGMVLARSCALTAVSACLAEGLRQKDNTVRQRLREWCYSNFLAYRSRLEGLEGEEVFFVGRREDLLRRESGEWKIAQRRIIFDGLVLNAPNLSIVF